MKIVVISDTHLDTLWLDHIKKACADADCVFHLGDVVSDAKKLQEAISCPVHMVRGNCDLIHSVDESVSVSVDGVKIFATHGNRYRVEDDLMILSFEARSREVNICLYGHTHIPDITNLYGIWFINPGSLSRPRGGSKRSYAVIEKDKNGNIYPYIMTL